MGICSLAQCPFVAHQNQTDGSGMLTHFFLPSLISANASAAGFSNQGQTRKRELAFFKEIFRIGENK